MLNGFAYFKMFFEDNQPQDLIFLSVNRSFEPLTGLQDVVGKKVSQVIPGMREADPELFKFFARVALTGQPERLEIYVTSLEKWFDISAYSPAKEYFVTVFDVITERKQAEASLAQRVHALAALYAASQSFLGQIGVAATTQATCRLAVEHFQLKLAWVGLIHPGDYLVHPVASFGAEAGYLDAIRITWDDSPTGRGPTGTAIRTRQPFIMNHIETDAAFAPWREAAMARGYRSSLAIPLCTDGQVLGALNLYSEQANFFQADRLPLLQSFANQAAVALQKARFFEETRRYAAELEDRVAERTAQLEATNQELDHFAYSVSHDLRAPLRAMQGFSQALLEDYAGELDPGGQDYARRINAASERMDHLIQDLLAYSRISREEMALQPVSLEQTVAEAMAHLEGDIQARQARVRVEPPLPGVQAHRATLLQLVANLVSNAIKFTAPEVKPQVRLWAEDRGERVCLWVEDNGLGIAPEHQERIFRIFERLHGIEAYPGTGIGLAIVKKGVERMGGRVGVESELGQGSRFWVELGKAG
jgi:signal transduction histidine kinase